MDNGDDDSEKNTLAISDEERKKSIQYFRSHIQLWMLCDREQQEKIK